MTGTAELAVREDTAPALQVPAPPNLPDVDSWIRAMSSIAKLASQICNTSFVPRGLRGDDASVTAAILTGRELGMGPMQALRHIHVVEGTPSLDAEYKRAKVLSLGHEFDILEWDDDHCKVAARRKGSTKPPLVAEYTMKDARRAQLVKDRGNYITRPKVMMLARVTTLVCNAIFADVTNGLATTELLESGDEDALMDAAGAALALPAPERQRVTAADARARHTVTAEVVTPDPSPAGKEAAHSAPSAPPVPDVPPAGEGPILTVTVEKIWARLAALGVEERNYVRVASQVAGKPMKHGTEADGRKILDTLEGLDATGLDGLLADLMMSSDPREDGEPGE